MIKKKISQAFRFRRRNSEIVIDIPKNYEIIGMEIPKASRIFSWDVRKVIETAEAVVDEE